MPARISSAIVLLIIYTMNLLHIIFWGICRNLYQMHGKGACYQIVSSLFQAFSWLGISAKNSPRKYKKKARREDFSRAVFRAAA